MHTITSYYKGILFTVKVNDCRDEEELLNALHQAWLNTLPPSDWRKDLIEICCWTLVVIVVAILPLGINLLF